MLAADLPLAFADPVLNSQDVFRTVLHVFAHPGTVCEMPITVESPTPLVPATAAICLTLLDHETPVWLQAPNVDSWLRFHCGSPIVSVPAQARFALIHDVATMPALEDFDIGSDEYPDRSTTLIIQVDGFVDSGLTLSGPGIRDKAQFGVKNLHADFFEKWRELAPLFPRGIDLIFTAGSRIAALPRTTRIGG
ncbi:MAG TPA: phosphonate C-P lyase system protein PhnH [Burkholderiales bacterium]|nr:phosphonate C-P lyase system protein PhnH [Burkholderiales bacterium]